MSPDGRKFSEKRRAFSRSYRLLRGADFLLRIRHGKRLSNDCFSLHYDPSDSGHARLGIAVGRRVSPKATRRNQIKRIIREVFRHHIQELPPVDLVILFKPPAARLTRKELRSLFSATLEQLKRRTS